MKRLKKSYTISQKLKNIYESEEAVRYLSLGIILILIFAFMAFYNINFISGRNINNLLRRISILGIPTIGMTIIMIGGEIDLSIGSVVSFCGLVLIIFMDRYGALAAILSCLACGIIFASLNAALTVKAKIPSFIVTLAMMLIIKGLTLITFGTTVRYDSSATLQHIKNGTLIGIPNIVVLLIITLAGVWYLLKHLILGRHIYAVGGNENACKLCGIKIGCVKYITFLIMGILASFTSLLVMANTNTMSVHVGEGLELEVIAAVLIGGASLSGGRGTVFGSILGVALLEVMGSALNFLGMPSDVQQIASGVILLLALLLSTRSSSNLSKA